MSQQDRLETLDLEQLGAVHGGMNPALMEATKTGVSMGLNVHHFVDGPHYENSRHWRGLAVDFGGTDEAMSKFRDWAMKQPQAHEVIYKDMHWVDGRRRKGSVPGHYNHIHYSVK